ncbi:MAG: class I SAM-dependent methyltransferase [Thermoplasmata archaeon]|jgi:SAM-dependent methyltransferase
MALTVREPNWRAWLDRWDAQQETFNPDRERRFEVMFEVLGASLPPRFTALDLGAGPGSLSIRLLQRFPSARSVAVDHDPVTRRVGQGAVGTLGGRLTWVDAKLGAPDWTDHLPARRFHAALSTTALHWLTPTDLRALYRDLGRLLPPGGIFLNGDHLPWGPRSKGLSRLAERVRRRRTRGATRGPRWNAWRAWWKDAEALPELAPYFQEHRRRAARHPRHGDTPVEFHVEALRRAGFHDVAAVWGGFEDWVLYARR